MLYIIGRDLSEDVPDNQYSIEDLEEVKQDQTEAGLDSDNSLDNSEEEDYPVEEGPGDFMVQENTTLYLPSMVQSDPEVIASGSSSQIL